MIALLLLCLMISCVSIPAVNVEVKAVIIPIPLPPTKPSVNFSDTGEGLFLSYEDGRKLAIYLVDVEAHRKELLEILEYYKEEN